MSRRTSDRRRTVRLGASDNLRARPLKVLAIALVATCFAAIAIVLVYVDFTLQSPHPPSLELALSDGIAFQTHVVLGTALSAANVSPQAAAIQWLKAASHARSDAEIERAGRGIQGAIESSRNNRGVLQTICLIASEGSPPVDQAVSSAHVNCPRD